MTSPLLKKYEKSLRLSGEKPSPRRRVMPRPEAPNPHRLRGASPLGLTASVLAGGIAGGAIWWFFLGQQVPGWLVFAGMTDVAERLPITAGIWVLCCGAAAALWRAKPLRSAFSDLEKLLHDERRQSQRMLDFTDAFCVALDLLNNIVAINQTGCRLLGFSRDKLIGKNWFHPFVAAEFRQKVKEEFFEIPEGGDFVKQLRFPVILRGGEEKTLDWKIIRLADDAGNPYALLCHGEEIAAQTEASSYPAETSTTTAPEPESAEIDAREMEEIEQRFRELAEELAARKDRIRELTAALENVGHRAESEKQARADLETQLRQTRTELENKIRDLATAQAAKSAAVERSETRSRLEEEAESLRAQERALAHELDEARQALLDERLARESDSAAFRVLREQWRREKEDIDDRVDIERKKRQAEADARRLLEEELRHGRDDYERRIGRLVTELEAEQKEARSQKLAREKAETEMAELRRAVEQYVRDRLELAEAELTQREQNSAVVFQLAESRHRALADHAGLLVVHLSRDAAVTGFNTDVERLLGWSPDAVQGRNFFGLILPEETRDLLARHALDELKHRPVSRLECALDLGANAVHVWRWTLVGEGGAPTLAIGKDITDSKRFESVQEENRVFLQELIRNSADGFIRIDESGAIVGLNTAAERLFGCFSADVFHQSVETLLPGSGLGDPQRLNRYVFEFAAALGKSRETLFQARHQDGTVFDVELWVGEMWRDDRREYLCLIRPSTTRRGGATGVGLLPPHHCVCG
jgi:PAS domain S-box-containing protein